MADTQTAKEKVLAVYPKAHAHYWGTWRDGETGVTILTGEANVSEAYPRIGAAERESEAWQDAASRLPTPPVALPAPTEPSGATELPELDERIERLNFERWYAANRLQLYMHLDTRLRCAIEDTARECWMQGLRDYKAKLEAAMRDSSDYERIIAECHVLLDQAGVAQATGAVCNDPTCTSKLGHRLRTLIAASSSRGSEVAR